MSKYYYHGTDKNSFYKILETKEIKCRRLIEEEKINITRTVEKTMGPGANGYEYISVCNKNSFYDSEDAFNTFIRDQYCFIISDDVDAIKTINLRNKNEMNKYRDKLSYFACNNSDSEIRFSIMSDEYHIKTRIPLSKIIGFGFPFNRINSKELEYLFELSYELRLDIVNTSEPYFIEEYEAKKNIRKVKALNNRG